MSEDELDVATKEAETYLIRALEIRRARLDAQEKTAREEFGDELVDLDIMISKQIYGTLD